MSYTSIKHMVLFCFKSFEFFSASLRKNHLLCIVGILKNLWEHGFLFLFQIPYIYVITLVATRNLVFSHSKTLSTEHIGVSTKRRFGTTSFGYGDNGEPLRGRQNNMKNILVALAIFME